MHRGEEMAQERLEERPPTQSSYVTIPTETMPLLTMALASRIDEVHFRSPFRRTASAFIFTLMLVLMLVAVFCTSTVRQASSLPSLHPFEMDALADFVRKETMHGEHGGHTNAAASAGENQVSATPAGGMMHGMSPFLFTRTTEFFVLFEGAFVNSTGGFVGALILSFLFAVIATVVGQVIRLHENIALADGSIPLRMIASVLHGLRQFLHYAAMLIVMTMNVWLIIAVVVGHAVGWLLYSVLLHNRFKSRTSQNIEETKATDVACDC